MATDFGGRSFDFQAGAVEDYRPLIEALMAQWRDPDNTVSPPGLVAEVIFNAVTDGTDQLRYRAGNDAHYLLDKRKTMTDPEFFDMMSNRLKK